MRQADRAPDAVEDSAGTRRPGIRYRRGEHGAEPAAPPDQAPRQVHHPPDCRRRRTG